MSEALQLAIDSNNPFGVVGGVATRWITREKTCVLISSMGDRHIINTINMLERKLEAQRSNADAAWGFYADCRGEMASYYAGHMVEEAEDQSLLYQLRAQPILAGLRAEAQKRGLHEVLKPP